VIGVNPYAMAADILEKGSALTVEEFCFQYLHERLYSKQREVTASVMANRRTAVKSCHDAGKSYLASRVATWWIKFHPPGEAFVVSTAPSDDQVKAILWREINKAHKKGKLEGRTNQKEWWVNDELVAFGRKPQDTDPGAFQGIHALYVLVIIDEASWVPKDLWMAAGSLAANEGSRILAIGNPDDPGSHFAEVCKPGSGWNVIKIGYQDTPNFSGEEVDPVLKSLLISHHYVDEMRKEVGEGSAPFMSKCLGEFPESAEDAVTPMHGLTTCMQPNQIHAPNELLPVELGWDIGAGGDRSVVRERRGLKAGRFWYPKGGQDTMAQVGDVVEIINQSHASSIKVDNVGVGWGACNRLEELRREGKHKAKVVRVNVSEVSTKPDKYRRLRDEIWWDIAHDRIGEGTLDLFGLDDPCVAQLLAPRWSLDSSGRINVEAKEETKDRLGRSPDDADALLLAYYAGGRQGQAFLEMWRKQIAQAKAGDKEKETEPEKEASTSTQSVEPSSSRQRPARPQRRRLMFPQRGERILSPSEAYPNTSSPRCQHRWRKETGRCVFCGEIKKG
jgi:hypothetical protein